MRQLVVFALLNEFIDYGIVNEFLDFRGFSALIDCCKQVAKK